MWNSQIELEEEMMYAGRERARLTMDNNEQKGRASSNPYAAPLFRRFTQPLSDIIQADLTEGGAGMRKSHVKLLKPLDPDVTAYIAVRVLFTELMKQQLLQMSMTSASTLIARAIQSEQIMEQLKMVSNEDWFYLQQELDRRCSTDIRHRVTIAKMKLKSHNVESIDWGPGNRVQVGAYLISMLATLGMVDISTIRKGKKTTKMIDLTADCLDLIGEVRDITEEALPYWMPSIEKPIEWTGVFDGGFHTEKLQKIGGPFIKGGASKDADLTVIMQSVNALQGVKWKVNEKVLDVAVSMMKKGMKGAEIVVGENIRPKPDRPSFLDTVDKENFSPEQLHEFKSWKRQVADWKTECKLQTQSKIRMMTAFNVANKFRAQREIFFVYQADFRGRMYPKTTGISPQGSDLQRAMICFSEGKPVRGDAEKWFLIHGANKFGVDKVDFNDRIKWVKDNKDYIIQVADDPLGSTEFWEQADKPFQFLAWCMEYAEFTRYGAAFVSYLSMSQDGSCNGLQNFSAMLRDDVGGKATNLLPSKTPNDIYGQVATVTMDLLGKMEDDEHGYKQRWLKHGINRKLVKRSVMTLPYGSTRFSCADFIVQDYMKVYLPVEFDKKEYSRAATWLSHVVWKAIAKVVIKAREGMDWLQECAKLIIEAGQETVKWETPTGFVVNQRYQKVAGVKKVMVNVFGMRSKFLVGYGVKAAGKKDHVNGVAPNFIHSMDASHMQLVAIQARSEKMSVAMIHDDFGVHAADTERFHRIIREQFVNIYTEDHWLDRFYQLYKDAGIDLPNPPERGSLDLTQVLVSPYFFA